MKISSDLFVYLKSSKRNIRTVLGLFFLFITFIFVFFELSLLFSMVILSLFFLILPGYFFAEILFKWDEIVDKLLIGYGLSIFNTVMSFYILLFLYKKPVDTFFSRLFLIFLWFESFILILANYFDSKATITRKFQYDLRPARLLARSNHLLLSILLGIILLGQILLIKIHLYWPDEHTYVYTSRNLLHANYSFTPLPPVMDPRLWTPRYVFIGMNTLFYLYFKLSLTSPQPMMIISSLILILATFALAKNLYSEKVGLVAGFYIAFNPIFWWIVRRVVPDMLVAALLWSGIHFMIKACKHDHGGPEFRWQYIPISGLFLGLAVLVKLTVVFLIPTFLIILLVFRQRIGKKRTSLFYMIGLAGAISLFGVFLASERYTEYLLFLLRNFSYFLNRWDWDIAYASMIEPLLIISPVFIFSILGILFDVKQKDRRQNMIILLTAWATYFFLPLILPDQALDPRHVFPAHVGPSILAAFGTVEVTKREKLWERILYSLILVQVFYETLIREYVRISQVSRVLTEIVLVFLVLVVLRKAVQKIKRQPSQLAPKARAVVLLGLILVLFINGHTLNSLGWSSRTRRIRLEILSATQTSLELSGNWLIENTDESSILMTNEFIRLPYYAEFRITYPLPAFEFSFLQEVEQENIEYLILFWSIWSERYPYMFKYIETPPSNMIEMIRWEYTAEGGRELGFVIYKVF